MRGTAPHNIFMSAIRVPKWDVPALPAYKCGNALKTPAPGSGRMERVQSGRQSVTLQFRKKFAQTQEKALFHGTVQLHFGRPAVGTNLAYLFL